MYEKGRPGGAHLEPFRLEKPSQINESNHRNPKVRARGVLGCRECLDVLLPFPLGMVSLQNFYKYTGSLFQLTDVQVTRVIKQLPWINALDMSWENKRQMALDIVKGKNQTGEKKKKRDYGSCRFCLQKPSV